MSDVDWDNVKSDKTPEETRTSPIETWDWNNSYVKEAIKRQVNYAKCMTLMNPIKYELVDPSMAELNFATEGSVGMDLYNRQEEKIPPFAVAYKIPLNVKVSMPSQIWLMLACRSSFPIKYPGLLVANGFGAIDSDYNSEICLLVTNFTSEIKVIPRGSKIAQLIAMPSIDVNFEKVEFVDPNPQHEGFGSTGS